METPILIGTGVVALGALVLIYLLLKMIVTRDYSLLLNVNERKQAHQSASRTMGESLHPDNAQAAFIPNSATLEQRLAVAHFMPELPEWKSKSDRTEAAEDLAEIRKRRQKN